MHMYMKWKKMKSTNYVCGVKHTTLDARLVEFLAAHYAALMQLYVTASGQAFKTFRAVFQYAEFAEAERVCHLNAARRSGFSEILPSFLSHYQCRNFFPTLRHPAGSRSTTIEQQRQRLGECLGEYPVRMESERYLSADRKMKTYLAYSLVLLVVFAFAAYKATKDRTMSSVVATILVASVFLVLFLFCDLTLRLCQTLVSFTTDVGQQQQQQHGESFWSVARYHFTLNTPSATIVIVSALLVLTLIVTVRGCPLTYAWNFGPSVCVPLLMFAFFLLRASNLAEWEVGSLSDLSAMKGLDYGTGMAFSYYYGYLRIILPSAETTKKGIIEKIENFEDKHNVTFPIHKLFILIPSSGYIPPDLKEASYQWMESASELEEDKRNRAGNIGRSYRNIAYKIYPDGRNSGSKPVYVVVEGATPLLTYYEVQKHNHPESVIYKRFKRKIIEMFHRKLQETLQSDPETRDLCELIYYNDYDAKGERVNVAKVILERIAKIKDFA